MFEIINKLNGKKKFALRSQGYSMMPVVRSGDLVYIRKTKFQHLKVNEIILARKSKETFIHRLVYKTKAYAITKGDNNRLTDGKIYPGQIMGKVYRIKRNNQIFRPEDIYLFQSSHYFKEIGKIKQIFDKGKIDFVFLKGLPLHLYYENAHPKRIYADCDVLIREKDFTNAEKILSNNGYKESDTAYSNIHKILKNKKTETVFSKKINNFPVIFDVHFEVNFMMNQLGKLDQLYPQSMIDRLTKDTFNTKRCISINGNKFLILNSEFLILYLALHFFHHNFRGAYRLEFLDKVIRKAFPVSPPEVFLALTKKVLDYRLQNFVYPVFLLLKKYYQTPLPDKFLNSIRPDQKRLSYIKKNILKINIFNDETRIQAGINRFKNLFFLSPHPLWRRLMIVFNIQVIYSFFWVMIFFFFSTQYYWQVLVWMP